MFPHSTLDLLYNPTNLPTPIHRIYIKSKGVKSKLELSLAQLSPNLLKVLIGLLWKRYYQNILKTCILNSYQLPLLLGNILAYYRTVILSSFKCYCTFVHLDLSLENKNDYGHISLGHIIPFVSNLDSQTKTSFHFISFHWFIGT